MQALFFLWGLHAGRAHDIHKKEFFDRRASCLAIRFHTMPASSAFIAAPSLPSQRPLNAWIDKSLTRTWWPLPAGDGGGCVLEMNLTFNFVQGARSRAASESRGKGADPADLWYHLWQNHRCWDTPIISWQNSILLWEACQVLLLQKSGPHRRLPYQQKLSKGLPTKATPPISLKVNLLRSPSPRVCPTEGDNLILHHALALVRWRSFTTSWGMKDSLDFCNSEGVSSTQLLLLLPWEMSVYILCNLCSPVICLIDIHADLCVLRSWNCNSLIPTLPFVPKCDMCTKVLKLAHANPVLFFYHSDFSFCWPAMAFFQNSSCKMQPYRFLMHGTCLRILKPVSGS